MNEQNLINYYNKFNEDKRLNSRHGIIEFTVSMNYIEKFLKKFNNPKILDIGAGTGKYSIYLADKGYSVTAVELVKHNLRIIEKNSSKVKAYLGNAINLSKFKDKSYDIILLFGPMYHLITKEEKLKALEEAKRVLTDDGYIFIQYCMNDYAIIKHGFMDQNIIDSNITNDFKVISKVDDLYSYVRLDDINLLNNEANLERVCILSPEGPADYIRPYINKLNEDEFNLFINYILTICERSDMLGSGSHILDIVTKK